MVSAPILFVWWTFPQQRPRRVLSPSFQSTVELSPSSSSPSKIRRTDSPQSFSRQKRRLKSKWFFCTNARRIAIMSPKLWTFELSQGRNNFLKKGHFKDPWTGPSSCTQFWRPPRPTLPLQSDAPSKSLFTPFCQEVQFWLASFFCDKKLFKESKLTY